MQELLDKVELLKKEIEETQIQDPDQLERFRIRFLGTKGLVKELLGEMKHVSSDLKKDFGARLNEFKQFAPLGSLKITFQKFYRVTGESTQFKGVQPDIILPDPYEFIDVGEKELDYPLAWDTIPRQQFAQWTKVKYSLKDLSEKSKKRVSANPKFGLVRKQAQTIKQRRDETVEPESLEEYRAEQERMKAENKELDALKTEIEGMTTRTLKADELHELPEQKEKNNDWYKQIRKDITIAEAIAILNDMNKASGMN